MSKKIKNITAENFSEAVDYAYTLNKKMTANVLAKKILIPLGSIVFALNALLLFMGTIYAFIPNEAARTIVFDKFKFVASYWDSIWGMCCNISDLVYIQVALMVLYLFIVPFVICSIIAIIISYTAKGTESEFKGNDAQKAKKLYDYLDNCPRTYFEAFDGTPVLWRRTTGIVSGILVIVFMIYYYGCGITQSTDFAAAFSAMFQPGNPSDPILICIFSGLLFYVPYAVLHYLFTLLIQPYCDSYNKWSKFLDEAEYYWLSVDNVERKKRALQKEKEKEERRAAANASSASSSSPSLTYAQKFDYINRHFGGLYSFAAIEFIENDPSLSPSEKEEMKIFLRAFGD